ncbi:helix-turn-helix domain-containing protein [Kribbella qitaiheensis]|uniref:Helix-turn-helix domain-containing protein n=1 Tax=Kribbella qitaiheensis TaxID=1544730 RepID=A0A7G6WXH2_9ACTN|nr:helix-turn-helix domain-containing protein [Kribbella qitaiheensis]QNE18687.1 helix-turn-helix domain-containing protein [Kribbella qitaiheensis]
MVDYVDGANLRGLRNAPNIYPAGAHLAATAAATAEALGRERVRRAELILRLGTRFGIHPDTAGLILRRERVAMRPKGLAPKQVVEAARLYEEGWSSARIGRRLGFNGATIVTALSKQGVRTRGAQERPR